MTDMDVLPEGYKATELGVLPEEWEIVSLKKCNEKMKETIDPSKYPDEVFEYYSIPAYQNGKKPEYVKGSTILSLKLILQHKSVLFGKLNPRVERIWNIISESPFRKIGSTEWLEVFPNPEYVNPDFLYFIEWSDYVLPLSKTFVSGSTPSRQRVDHDAFYNLKIPLPLLPEQHAIATTLRTVQEAKEKTDEVIAATKALKAAMMKHLFTYGPVPPEEAERVALKETEIGEVPVQWEIKKFEDFCILQRGQDLRICDIQAGNIPVIGATTIIGYHNVANVKGPGVTVVRSGSSSGKPMYIEEDFWAHNVVLYVKDFKGNNPKFVYSKLQQLDLTQYKSGVSVPTLNRNTFSMISVDVPPKKIQDKIVETIIPIDQKLAAEQSRKEALDTLFASLLHDLMTAKIRVSTA